MKTGRAQFETLFSMFRIVEFTHPERGVITFSRLDIQAAMPRRSGSAMLPGYGNCKVTTARRNLVVRLLSPVERNDGDNNFSADDNSKSQTAPIRPNAAAEHLYRSNPRLGGF